MNEIKLGKEQQGAINSIKDFIKHSNKTPYSLIGYAGTGKSTIIKKLVEFLEEEYIDYVLCAPTHKARSVIQYATEREAITIHQLLKLSPQIEILDLDLRNLIFLPDTKKGAQIPYKGVVICDESSMVNDDLYNLLISRAKAFSAKIIFVGDIAQLKPVKSTYSSLVFNVEDKSELTTIYRQSYDSGLSTVLPTLRENTIPRFKEAIGKEGSLICVTTPRDLFVNAFPSFEKAVKDRDIFESKIYAYTNIRTTALNNKMRSLLFPGDEEYYNGEILTAYENFSSGFSSYWNSMDYIIAEEPKKYDKLIPNFTKVPGYILKLYDTANKSYDDVFIISREVDTRYLNSLSGMIEDFRTTAIKYKQIKDRRASDFWKKYYETMESFCSPFDLIFDNRVIKKRTFDYGYASTVHKSQGSSINNVFIDMQNIFSCRDTMELRQMQYVSISRARKNAYILQWEYLG